MHPTAGHPHRIDSTIQIQCSPKWPAKKKVNHMHLTSRAVPCAFDMVHSSNLVGGCRGVTPPTAPPASFCLPLRPTRGHTNAARAHRTSFFAESIASIHFSRSSLSGGISSRRTGLNSQYRLSFSRQSVLNCLYRFSFPRHHRLLPVSAPHIVSKMRKMVSPSEGRFSTSRSRSES